MSNEQFVDQSGRPINMVPRDASQLDVGSGGPINRLMDKLMAAKEVMRISEQEFPYEKTGVKRKGSLVNLEEEAKQANKPKSLKAFKESIEDEYEEEPVKQQVKPKRKPIYEEEEYITYAKNGVDEDDDDERYDTRKSKSLTSELMMATKAQGRGKTLPNMDTSLDENVIMNSKLPDFIKQSYLKNPPRPANLAAALGGGQLDAITEEFRKQKMLKNKESVQHPQQQRKILKETKAEPIPGNKRERIKAQLKPLVEELIREILLEKL